LGGLAIDRCCCIEVRNCGAAFWMLPLLGILGLKAKDLIGYSYVQFLVHFPIVLSLGAVLMRLFTWASSRTRRVSGRSGRELRSATHN